MQGQKGRQAYILVNGISTLCCHAETKFPSKYQKWAKEHWFESMSMLPSDVKACKDKQQSINAHLTEQKLAEKPIQALEHLKFKEIIDVTAQATNGIKIPGRKVIHAHKLEHVTCNNATYNGTILQEFARLYEANYNKKFPWRQCKKTHVINIVTQTLISSYSNICIKECLLVKQKELYRNVQTKGEMNKEHVDIFIYEMGYQKHDLARHTKIDFLQLSEVQ
ncbi:hypothetical protein BDR06DRAFT_976698 [Suillus hirtellus]|nr:hypothetical protein BDR06DRAFT_976698 [Suillus hirtellus]